jgi:ferrous iron transport protein A
MQTKSLIQLKVGEKGRVISIESGFGMRRRIDNLGLRIGSEIIKVSSHFWRGPVTIRVNNSLIALGHRMASRIIVEVK